MIKSHVIIPSKKKKKKSHVITLWYACRYVRLCFLQNYCSTSHVITLWYACTFVITLRSSFKVCPPNSKSKYPKGPKLRHTIQTKNRFHQFNLVFFFFWESSTSTDSPQTSYTHTSYPLPPSPFQFTRCVSVSHNHTPIFLNERWGWIRLKVTFALDVSRCFPKLSRPSSPFIQSPNKGSNLLFHVLCSTNKLWIAWLPSFFEWDNVNLRLVGLNCWGYYIK